MRDVIVIGAGGGGPVVAAELAGRGLDVLVLEGGPRHADPTNEWSHAENNANNPNDGYLSFGPEDRDKPAWFREWADNKFVWELSGVGGTTQHYFGNGPRPAPGVFRGYDGADAAEYDTAHLFPFNYEEFCPCMEWVEATLPVETAAMGTKEALMFRGCEGVGLPVQTSRDITRPSFRPQQNATLQPGGYAGRTDDESLLAYPSATGCTCCGHCFQGCYLPEQAPRNQLAKRSTDNSYVPLGLAADAVRPGGRPFELLADSFVRAIRHERVEETTVARGVTWRDNSTGENFSEDAHVVVFAGGATESPRLWFNSGLPNPNDWVGRGHTDHHFDWVVGAFDEYTGNSKGANSAARLDWPGRGGMENVELGPAIQAFTMNGAAAKIDISLRGRTARTRGNREFMVHRSTEFMRAAGAKKVYRLDWAPLLLHVHSSMRMGESDHDSVLDANAEARWVKRLFIADNSALANGLGGPNPTLATQALATRTAEKIFRLYFDGDTWVDKESPIVSTDPRISVRMGELGL